MGLIDINRMNKIKFLNVYNNKWQFIFPESYYDDDTLTDFEKGVEYLGIDDNAAEKIFKKLINKHPFHIDAYNHLSLAFRNQGKFLESFVFAEKAFNLAKVVIPESIDIASIEIEWSYLQNRPFLRACNIYAMEFHKREDYKSAIELYNLILNLNKNDNQGIEYQLFEINLKLKKYNDARKILNKNKDNQSIEFIYGQVVLDILQCKEDQNLKNLEKAFYANKYFYNELQKPLEERFIDLKSLEENIYTMDLVKGSLYEAYEYWINNKSIYSLEVVDNYFIKNKISVHFLH